jgi:hypothetical protein
MSKNGEQKKKVFLCYARESQPIIDDFYDRFKNYNDRDMEILYDRNADSRNMHTVFSEFANQCDIALLLVNARFVNPESYANQYEIPVLLERQKKSEVIVIGVRFSNVSDLEDWNADGDVFFFSLTNNDLPCTRDKNPKNELYLRKFAVYKQVDEDDRDDFHDQLRLWIKKCLKKSIPKTIEINEVENSEVKRPKELTDTILAKLTGFYRQIEELLSMNNEIWKGNTPQNNDWSKSFGSIYFESQVKIFSQIQKDLEGLSTSNGFFSEKLHKSIPQIGECLMDLRLLLEMSDAENMPLFQCLQQIENSLNLIKKKLLSKSNTNASDELKNILFPQFKGFIAQLIAKMSDIDNEFKRMMS